MGGRVSATPPVLELLERLALRYGPLVIHQSGGCCDGSLPMCFRVGEFIIGDHDVLLGVVGDSLFYIDHRQYEVWKATRLTLDVVEGEPEGFSLPAGPGRHFVTRSRVCDVPSLN
jgi:uncharacterized protein (DUF779 family)